MSALSISFTILATAAIAAGQTDKAMAAGFVSGIHVPRQNALGPRRLNPGSTVCVNPPLNLTGMEIDSGKVSRELAQKIREAGFRSQPLGAIDGCDATVFTEIVSVAGRDRKTVELEFRIVVSGEQIPRLCSSARGRSLARHDVLSGAWRDALFAAFADEARQIRAAQAKGMEIYRGAVE